MLESIKGSFSSYAISNSVFGIVIYAPAANGIWNADSEDFAGGIGYQLASDKITVFQAENLASVIDYN